MSNLKSIITKVLIYMIVLAILLPTSLIASIAIAPKAHAESKVVETKTKLKVPANEIKAGVKQEIQKPVVKPFLISHKGLKEEYISGEKVNAIFVFSGKVTNAWAVASSLDPSFPKEMVLKNLGSGVWQLETPVLTRNLNTGTKMIYIYAENGNGTINQAFQVKLQKRNIVPVKISKKITNDTHLYLTWTKFKSAYSYTITFKKVRDGEEMKIETRKPYLAVMLEPGTLYNYDLTVLSPKSGEVVGRVTESIKTFGIPQLIQSSQNSVQVAKKEIGQGSSTMSEKVKGSKEQTVQSPVPTPSSSPQGEAEEKEGWSRLLVALAILVIAAGAAIGGYYGYEWYASRHDDEDTSEPKSGSRW